MVNMYSFCMRNAIVHKSLKQSLKLYPCAGNMKSDKVYKTSYKMYNIPYITQNYRTSLSKNLSYVCLSSPSAQGMQLYINQI